MGRRLCWVGVATVVVASLVVGARPAAHRPSPVVRAHRLATELRCPVCQGLSVADSPSPTAESIRADIRRRIGASESDDDIRNAYVERYGQWILLRPPASGFGALVWTIPAVAVGLATIGLALALGRWRGRRLTLASDDDRELVQSALGRPLGHRLER